MQSINCAGTIKALSAYQDGELDPRTAGLVRTHLEQCDSCRREWRTLETIYTGLKARPATVAPEGFTARVMARVKEKPQPRPFALPRLVYSLVFALFLVLGLWFTWMSGTPGSSLEAGTEDITLAGLLVDSQDLGLINIQENTLALLVKSPNGVNHEK